MATEIVVEVLDEVSITVPIRDGNDNPVVGVDVLLADSAGSSTSDEAGDAHFTLRV